MISPWTLPSWTVYMLPQPQVLQHVWHPGCCTWYVGVVRWALRRWSADDLFPVPMISGLQLLVPGTYHLVRKCKDRFDMHINDYTLLIFSYIVVYVSLSVLVDCCCIIWICTTDRTSGYISLAKGVMPKLKLYSSEPYVRQHNSSSSKQCEYSSCWWGCCSFAVRVK